MVVIRWIIFDLCENHEINLQKNMIQLIVLRLENTYQDQTPRA